MAKDFSVVVLLSGRGSNFESLAEQAEHFSITKVISNKVKALGLRKASSLGIPIDAFSQKELGSVLAQKEAIYSSALESSPDLIVLAGYMQILEPDFVTKNFGKVINIHPSLLPKYPGLDTHKRAIDNGDTLHGCSVHFVDVEVDTGPVIAQATCAIEPGDTPDSLSQKLLTFEHKLYPWCVNQIAAGEISLGLDRKVSYSPASRQSAKENGFLVSLDVA